MKSIFSIPQETGLFQLICNLYTGDSIDNANSKTHTEYGDDNTVVSHGQNIDDVSEIAIDYSKELYLLSVRYGDVPRSISYGVYISQLIRFARASSHVADFNTRNKLLTQKLL